MATAGRPATMTRHAVQQGRTRVEMEAAAAARTDANVSGDDEDDGWVSVDNHRRRHRQQTTTRTLMRGSSVVETSTPRAIGAWGVRAGAANGLEAQDVVFIDPPWGGPEYKELDQVDLFLGEQPLFAVCEKLRGHAQFVVLKVPMNFDDKKFAANVSGHVDVRKDFKKMHLVVLAPMTEDSLSLSRIFGASPNAVDGLASPVALRRMTSASSTASMRRMTTFSDFLSDDSDDDTSRRSDGDPDDDLDDDDASARALQRMQGLEDDMTYMTPAFLLESPNAAPAPLPPPSSSWQASNNAVDTSFRLSSPNARPPLPTDGTKEPTRGSNDSYDTSFRLQSPTHEDLDRGGKDSYDASFRLHSLLMTAQGHSSGDSYDESFRLHSLPVEDGSSPRREPSAGHEHPTRGSDDSYDTSFRLHSPPALEGDHWSDDTSFRLNSPPGAGPVDLSFGPMSTSFTFPAGGNPTHEQQETTAFYDDGDDDAIDDPRRLSDASSSSSSSSSSSDDGSGFVTTGVDDESFSSNDTSEQRTFFVDSVDSISVLDLPASPSFPTGVSASVTSLPANEAPSLAFSLSGDLEPTEATAAAEEPRYSASSSISSSSSSASHSADDTSFSSNIDDSFIASAADDSLAPRSSEAPANLMLMSFVSTSSTSIASKEADASFSSELPPVVPIKVVNIGAEVAPPPTSTSPPTAVSIDSSRPSSDISLDFTGVYLGDTSDSGRGRPHSHPHPHKSSSISEMPRPPTLRRVVSAQQASEAKVAAFFRRTYHQQLDDDGDDDAFLADLPSDPLARHRARTLASDQHQLDEHGAPVGRSRRSSTSAVRLMDLGHLQIGQRVEDVLQSQPRSSRRTTRLNEELLEPPSPTKSREQPLPAAVVAAANASPPTAADNLGEHDQVVPRSLYISFDDSAAQPDSPNMIPRPPDFLLSPEPPRQLAGSSSPDRSVAALPSLSVTPSAALGASAMAAASPMVALSASKIGNADVAPGFRWQQQQEKLSDDASSPGIKESIWHLAGALSIGGGRPSTLSLAQRLSASLRRTLGLAPPSLPEVTSPKSVCSAPPRLPRGFDDRGFYASFGNIPCGDRAIVVGKPSRLLHLTKAEQLRQRQLQRQALLLLLALVMGVGLGVLWIHVDGRPSALVPSPKTQRDDTIPTALRWILLPSELFWRCWSCVTLPLLVCYVINGLAELTMTHKAGLVLGLRSIGYLLLTSSIATLEGVAVAAAVHWLGVLRPSTTLSPAVAMAHARRANGTAAFVCAKELSYLQTTDGKSFTCSNASLALPVESAIQPNGSFSSSAALRVQTQ
ncbi:hypothetical protein P43SY_000993 [Pythium insidiosum]|uniref:Trimethylguanosine synthase n=1 Tax=Pythium insidiosum TaxID=114742 RepID=A0AAD5Q284_PYTIN|nr:hypothetical protein P43SY_000993 [Pythium insidiosum]